MALTELHDQITSMLGTLKEMGDRLDLAGKRQELTELEQVTQKEGFWDSPDEAQKHMQKISRLQDFLAPWEGIIGQLGDLGELAELGVAEGDESLTGEIEADVEKLQRQVNDLEFQAILGGRYDSSNAILSINAGAGGTEACDWADMLLRMYQMWAEGRRYGFELLSFVEGEAAGFSSVTARVVGNMAYGYLKAEQGVHRLVRLSPFDQAKRRHTSFASVDVIPEIGEDVEVDIPAEDLRVDTYRAGSAGGQHVNKTDSAVRITHLPTGIVVSCQNERSQHANRRTAMGVLRAKLFELERQKRRQQLAALRGEQSKIDFGSQIRSYVMQPYTMVKDHRTNHETANVQAVLDGDLDDFIRAYLQMRVGESGDSDDEA
ncbi:peptide chain release factor 2 [bacterium]|nr:peptide chain release factor 2 [bacterium]